MREQLIQYVELLFVGAPNAGDMKQEILQNTLDRYDDLIAQGKQPEAAYRLAISGIGDINELLGSGNFPPSATAHPTPTPPSAAAKAEDPVWKKLLRAVAIGLYILSMIPLFVLSEMGMETLGLCGTLSIVAVATVLILLGQKRKDTVQTETASPLKPAPAQELRRSVRGIIWAIGIAAYFIVSYCTNAWFITWVLFPLTGAVQGLMIAIMDLREATSHEN